MVQFAPITSRPFAANVRWRLIACALVLAVGCSRSHYRQRADRDASAILVLDLDRLLALDCGARLSVSPVRIVGWPRQDAGIPQRRWTGCTKGRTGRV
ncbi:MAG TPA: hypothetical protein VML55_13585 [Planctomycetaceae bacterium]|nr:hypothetical protein [Planctomycetaceae bacterium]